jgi:glyoxylase-like metal-dependent hydrolase (beta-lactamase superfamily II)
MHNFSVVGFVIATLIALAGCSSTPNKSEPARIEFSNAPEMTLTHGDGRIGTYVSSWNGFRTSSYWIEGPDGLVLIDTQFLPSAAEEFLNWAEKATGKKAVLAIVLHPNPDKFNGTATFQKRGIRVITSDQVLSLIPSVHKLRISWFYDRFKPDYPFEEPHPNSFGSQTTEIKAAGLTLKAHVLGAGCSGAHVAVEFDHHLFVGDLITQGFHSWLELGKLNEWLKRLSELRDLAPKYVHTGRGGSGDPDLLDREEQYLKTVLRIVKEERAKVGKTLIPQTRKRILNRILSAYPAYEYPNFVSNGIEEVWTNIDSH